MTTSVSIEIEVDLAEVECEADSCQRKSRTRIKIVSTDEGEVDTQEYRLCDMDAYAITSGAIFILTLGEEQP